MVSQNKTESTLFGTRSRVSHAMISTENHEKANNKFYRQEHEPMISWSLARFQHLDLVPSGCFDEEKEKHEGSFCVGVFRKITPTFAIGLFPRMGFTLLTSKIVSHKGISEVTSSISVRKQTSNTSLGLIRVRVGIGGPSSARRASFPSAWLLSGE